MVISMLTRCERPDKKDILKKLVKYITNDTTIKSGEKEKTFEELDKVLAIGCEDTIKKIRKELIKESIIEEKLKNLKIVHDLSAIIHQLSTKPVRELYYFGSDKAGETASNFVIDLDMIYLEYLKITTNDEKIEYLNKYRAEINSKYEYINIHPPFIYHNEERKNLYDPSNLANYVNDYLESKGTIKKNREEPEEESKSEDEEQNKNGYVKKISENENGSLTFEQLFLQYNLLNDTFIGREIALCTDDDMLKTTIKKVENIGGDSRNKYSYNIIDVNGEVVNEQTQGFVRMAKEGMQSFYKIFLKVSNINKIIFYDKKMSETYDINIKARGGKRKSKSKKNNVSKKPVVSQKKQSEYKEIFGKQMKIYKMPDSRKQYVRYKGELHSISDYKNLMKQKAAAKAKK